MANFLTKILTMGEGRQMREYEDVVEQINAFEPAISALTDEQLQAKTPEFRARLADGETLDDLLPEAFAVVREAAKRALGMRHFDVQLIGGIVLHRGMIAEMKTGEGKTLVATLPVYLNALAGKGVHVVTVNDYLAKRDSEWMGRVYRFLGLEVGIVQSQMDPERRKPAYAADVTYGTNSEFGFDYLRDNMVTRPELRVQRGHSYAIVDEVDSILIDEARTPLIISGAGTKSAESYKQFAKVVPRLKPDEDFEFDEAKRTIAPTEEGVRRVEQWLGIEDLYSDPSGQLVNHLQQALKAQFMFKRDVDYVVKDGEVLIVDEFTGRLMVGRRYSEGLHQAIEAKEKQHVREENQTLATITLQNFFRMYEKLAGMTGTAVTEDQEFREIYKLPVTVIPPNRAMIRDDRNDLIYRNVEAKFNAVIEEIVERNANGQPCLVGTISIENSERASRMLQKRGIPHKVLNAKFHEQEAHIIAQAGRLGAVTIATNMAGRGTDIVLGGNPDFLTDEILIERGIKPEEATEEQLASALERSKEICAEEHKRVVEAGGLAILGTERHESRRIDNQLRGRAGRQGDPGASQFYLSLEDDLMRLFGGNRMERVQSLMERTEIPEDMPIQAGMVSKAIESAQRQVEAQNFAARKYVLEYDDVMNTQRQVIYGERNRILDGKDIHGRVTEMMGETISLIVKEYCPEKAYSEEWDWDTLAEDLKSLTGLDLVTPELKSKVETPFELADDLTEAALAAYGTKETELGSENLRELERQVMLRVIDTRWMNHLLEMDYLREGIGLRAMGQRDPLVEYKSEAYEMFRFLVDEVNHDFLRTIMHIQVVQDTPAPEILAQPVSYSAPSEQSIFSGAMQQAAASVEGPSEDAISQAAAVAGKGGPGRTVEKDKGDPFANVGRNDPCPCGSGRKYKHCHGASA
ncbi:MAG: preprotein translocase subunit SecA [Actinobacteria bacterium HGW-Actinobacteria-1]|jgi:preprotein translocase subunit SecA|nr:MAG: preprotein translocase subunit SecA [Actinobacteria bacterium HGW-Actinobacteria-1]